ncbi:MAG: undecaprenyl/decaprenyl-phosphate alpha-N-acetylglucosaminyl 1-phosphate transferase [Aquificae bacterium]|nr:undecaprenyl/decaprenyl-phosphate alpha-N-acetylglucosaminyl 1-phosphate transferase [Aquificota bacterium]
MFLTFLVSFLISFFTQKFVILLFEKKKLFIDKIENNEPQKFHSIPTSRGGGIGIFLANFLLVLNPLGIKFLISGSLAFLSGLWEDLQRGLSPKIRLLFQILSAVLAVLLIGAVIKDIRIIEFPYPLAVLFTVFAIVGAINAINIIDGFNGLASGISLMILTSFGIVSYLQNDNELLFIILVNIGAILGFMVFNFPKGKIFLGDGGAYFLGFVIAEISILLPYRHEEVSPWFSLAVLVYPVWEVLFSFYRKTKRGLSPLKPDKFHFHMLINKRITKNNPATSIVIWIFAFPFTVLPVLYYNNTIACAFTALLFILIYNVLYISIIKFKVKNQLSLLFK